MNTILKNLFQCAQDAKVLQRILVLVLVVLASASAAEADAASFYQNTASGTVFIYNYNDETVGTGVYVDAKQRLVITAAHVVEDYRKVIVFFPYGIWSGDIKRDQDWYFDHMDWLKDKGYAVWGKVVARDANRDIAVLKLSNVPPSANMIELAVRPPNVGEKIAFIGNADECFAYHTAYVDDELAIKEWLVNGVKQRSAIALYIDGQAQPGDSGGPVFNSHGGLVGIISGGDSDTFIIIQACDIVDILCSLRVCRVVSIENSTNYTIHYQTRYSDSSDWESDTLEPGEGYTYWTRNSAHLIIRFDCSFESGFQEQQYSLEYYIALYGDGARPNRDDDAREYRFKCTGYGPQLYGHR